MGIKHRLKERGTLEAIYYLRTVEKLTVPEIAKSIGVAQSTIWRAISRFRTAIGMSKQQADDLIAFYEKEMQALMKKRDDLDNKEGRLYVSYSKLIHELQDKIAELLKLKDGISGMRIYKITYDYRNQIKAGSLRDEGGRVGSLAEPNAEESPLLGR